MIKCNVCNIEKETDLFRNKKKNPLCLECHYKQKKEKYRLDNPKLENVCIKCGIEKDKDLFVKNTNCCKECKSLYIKEYYQKNKENILEKEKNKYNDNKDQILERHKKYNATKKEERSIYQKEYRSKNKEELYEKRKKYVSENSEKLNKYRRKRYKERIKDDLHFKLSRIHRNILKRVLRFKKYETTSELLGYTSIELKENLESKFKEGMSWDNYGEWEIDHIRPVSSFDLEKTPPSVVSSLDNLQPLWEIENITKGNKYEL
jgi:hypothetical protein